MRLICASVNVGKAWVLASRALGVGHVDMKRFPPNLLDDSRVIDVAGGGLASRERATYKHFQPLKGQFEFNDFGIAKAIP